MAVDPNYLLDDGSTPPNQLQDNSTKVLVPPVPTQPKSDTRQFVDAWINNQVVKTPATTWPAAVQSTTATTNVWGVNLPNTQVNNEKTTIANNINTASVPPIVTPTTTSTTTTPPIQTQIPNQWNTSWTTSTKAPIVDTTITDLSKIDTSSIDPANFKYWQDAVTAWIDMNQRNYQLWAYYANKGMTDTTSIYNDLNKNPAYAKATEQDKQNTANNIAAQAAKFQKPNTDTTTATSTGDTTFDNSPAGIALRNIANINLDTANQLKSTLQNSINAQAQANLTKSQYSNFDNLSSINNNVLNAFTTWRQDLLKTSGWAAAGAAPASAEIQSLATKLWYTTDQVKSVLDGSIWQQLQPNDNQANTLAHDQFVQDQTTQKDRALQDAQDQLTITTRAINNQIDDVARQAQRTLQSTAVAWWLSWAIQSNWFSAGLQNIKDDANRTISRLNQQLSDINAADVKDRTRLMADFQQNLDRAKTNYDTQMQSLKLNVGMSVTKAQWDSSLWSDTLTKTLNDIYNNWQIQTWQVLQQYYANVWSQAKSLYAQSDALLAHQQNVANLQKTQQDNLFANNGEALLWLTTTDLQKMVKEWTITPQTYAIWVAWMVGKAVSTLQTMGNVTDADSAKIESLIKSGKSVPDAIWAIMNDGTNRFQNLTALYKQSQIANQQSLIASRWVKAWTTAPFTWNIATSAATIPDWSDWWQCAQFVNEVLSNNWQNAPFKWADQSLQAKIAQINSNKPTIGSVVVRQTNTPEWQKYWDLAIVVWVNWDKITIKWSNWGLNNDWTWDEKVYTQTINANDPGVKGYYDPALVTDADSIAQSVIDGKQPPDLKWLYSKAGPVKAILARKWYDLAWAVEDWNATQKYLSTLNWTAQTKLRQSVDQVAEQIPLIEKLNDDANSILNKSWITQFSQAQKKLAMNWYYWEDAKQAFNKLESQTAEVVSELAAVYQWGNSATEKSLQEAAKQLNTDRDAKTFQSNIDLIKKNITIRQNSLKNAWVAWTPGNYLPDTNNSWEWTTAPDVNNGWVDISNYKPTFKQ